MYTSYVWYYIWHITEFIMTYYFLKSSILYKYMEGAHSDSLGENDKNIHWRLRWVNKVLKVSNIYILLLNMWLGNHNI